MKHVLCFVLISILLCGCSKEKDLFQVSEHMTDTQRVNYAERTLGINIDKNHDWTLSRKYRVTVVANALLQDIREVSILSNNPFLKSAQSLVAVPATDGAQVNIEFRAPLSSTILHAACVNASGEMLTVPFVAGTDTVRFVKEQTAANSRRMAVRRSGTAVETVDVDDDLLYIPWNRHDYPELQQEALLFVPKLFPGSQTSNRPQVEMLNNHSLQTDWVGGQVTMTFLGGRTGNATTHIGYSIYPINDPTNVQTYIINDRFDAGSSDPLKNYMYDDNKTPTNYSGQKVALVWRDHTGNLKDALPPDMQVDFFVVADGQDLRADSIRVTVYSVNGRTYLSCEDGSDDTFNDKMFYIEEGIVMAPQAPQIQPQPVTPQVWTYAWEDKEKGDYDMNDCVMRVKVNDEDASKLDITLLAVGAQRDVWVRFAANDEDVFGAELHSVLGTNRGTLTNTTRRDASPITVTRPKPVGFDFQTNAFKLQVSYPADEAKLYGKDSYWVTLPTKGQDPHAIVIPGNWAWPQEKIAIVQAYPKFREWAKDVSNTKAQDWYIYPAEDKTMFIK